MTIPEIQPVEYRSPAEIAAHLRVGLGVVIEAVEQLHLSPAALGPTVGLYSRPQVGAIAELVRNREGAAS